MLMRLIFVRNILIKNAGSSKTLACHCRRHTNERTHTHWMMNSHTIATHTVCIYAYFMMSLTIWVDINCVRDPASKKELLQSTIQHSGGGLQWVWWQAAKVIFWFRAQPSAVFSSRLNIILEFVRVQCRIKSLFFSFFFARASCEMAIGSHSYGSLCAAITFV